MIDLSIDIDNNLDYINILIIIMDNIQNISFTIAG